MSSFFQDEMNELNSNLEATKAKIASIKGLREAQEGQKQSAEDAFINHLELGAGVAKTLPTEIGGVIRGGGGVIRSVGRYSTDAGGAFSEDFPKTATRLVQGRNAIQDRINGSTTRDAGDAESELNDKATSQARAEARSMRMNEGSGGEGRPMEDMSDSGTGGVEMGGQEVSNPLRDDGVEETKGYAGDLDSVATSDLSSDSGAFSGRANQSLGETGGNERMSVMSDITEEPNEAVNAVENTGKSSLERAGEEVAQRAGASTAEEGALVSAEGVADTASAVEGFLNPIADATALGLGLFGAFKAVKDMTKHNHNHPAQEAREAQAGANASVSDLASALNANHHQAITGGFGNIRQSQQSGSTF